MEVASLELSKTLFELSGWGGIGDQTHMWGLNSKMLHPIEGEELELKRAIPAYDLGYLLRKLPLNIDFNDEIVKLTLDRQSQKVWRASYAYPLERMKAKRKYADWKFMATQADTPEDAACSLAIQLFKEGILA